MLMRQRMPECVEESQGGRYAPSDLERAWVARIAAGDIGAFEVVFGLHYEPLCSFALQFVSSPDAARDVVQEIFVRVWEQRVSLAGCENLRAYLFTAVRNRCFKALRHGSVVRRSVERWQRDGASPGAAERPPSPEDQLEAAELASDLNAVLAELPERAREAFLLHRRQGLAYTEIAEVMDVSVRTVENHIARALRGLREGLRHWVQSEPKDGTTLPDRSASQRSAHD